MIGWQHIHAEALRRIQNRAWPPGGLIPSEVELAEEFGCARATVNRALQALADDGLLERKRKAGTRVTLTPERRAQISIPLIRVEIESTGATYAFDVLQRDERPMPDAARKAMQLPPKAPVQFVQTLHRADAKPFALEERWVHLAAARGFANAALDKVSANEWLVQNAAFSHGTLEYGAKAASDTDCELLNCPKTAALVTLERRTFGPTSAVTWVQLTYAPGYRLRLHI